MDNGDKSRDERGEESIPMVPLTDKSKDDVDEVKYKMDQSDHGLMHILSNHADKCSLNGVIFIKSSKYWVVKAIWTFLLIAMLALMVFHLHELGKKYYSYQKQTQVGLTKGKLRFPAITICNVNVLKKSKLKLATERLQKVVNMVNPVKLVDELDDWKPQYENETHQFDALGNLLEDSIGSSRKKRSVKQNTSNSNVEVKHRSNNFFDDFNTTDVDDYDDYTEPVYKDSWEAQSKESSYQKVVNKFLGLYSKETSTVRQKMGHQIQDMLIQCSFAGRQCVQKNFTLVPTSTLGNCYTLQYKKFVSRQSGPRSGLYLILYLESHEYLPGITNSRGAQLVIHEPRTIPFPDDEGFAISAGMSTAVGMRKIDIKRIGLPHGVCTQMESFHTKYGIKYTTKACQQLCLIETIQDNCGCYDETKSVIYKYVKLKKNLKPCQIRNDLMSCMSHINWYFNVNHTSCQCASPCRESTFRQSISAKPWPTNSFAKLIAKTICKEKPNSELCNTTDMDPIKLRENFVKVAIYFESLDYETLEEVEDYTLFQFLSDIGGTVGLYVGLSVLGAFEIVHMLFSILRYFFCRNWKTC